MAANTKYAPAPTQDPEEQLYDQAPPAYQAESSEAATARDDEARLFGGGAPRASQEDDLPDDFKVRNGSPVRSLFSLRRLSRAKRCLAAADTRASNSSVAPSLRLLPIFATNSFARSTPF